MWTKLGCMHSKSARDLLERVRLPFSELIMDHLETQKIEEALHKFTHQNTTPYIFFGYKHLGGYTELKDLDNKGELLRFAQDHKVK